MKEIKIIKLKISILFNSVHLPVLPLGRNP
jgi:hypothetical protein